MPVPVSENELGPQLNLPRIAGTGDAAERTSDRKVRARPSEVGMVRHVEELETELQLESLRDACILQHADVEDNVARGK